MANIEMGVVSRRIKIYLEMAETVRVLAANERQKGSRLEPFVREVRLKIGQCREQGGRVSADVRNEITLITHLEWVVEVSDASIKYGQLIYEGCVAQVAQIQQELVRLERETERLRNVFESKCLMGLKVRCVGRNMNGCLKEAAETQQQIRNMEGILRFYHETLVKVNEEKEAVEASNIRKIADNEVKREELERKKNSLTYLVDYRNQLRSELRRNILIHNDAAVRIKCIRDRGNLYEEAAEKAEEAGRLIEQAWRQWREEQANDAQPI